MEEELRKILELDEGANVVEAVKALKSKADSSAAQLTEGEQLKEKVDELTKTIALKERDEIVGKAINDGKLLPAQKVWADEYAMKDPKGFAAFVENAPKVIDLSEKGTQGTDPEDVQLTETEIEVAEKMGNTKEDLMNSKRGDK
jgi:phage I-like protein